jgi:hypothetical protein
LKSKFFGIYKTQYLPGRCWNEIKKIKQPAAKQIRTSAVCELIESLGDSQEVTSQIQDAG